LGVVVGLSPPEEGALDVVAVVELELELELELDDPQPAASRSARQGMTATGRPLLIGTILSRRTLGAA
jgi:hypothetical protein